MEEHRHLNIRFNFNNKKLYIPLFRSFYTIKLNYHPQRGLLIDLHMALPSPLLANRFLSLGKTFYFDDRQALYRVLVCRHWPKSLHEDRMMIITQYVVPFTELKFKGERDYPPGNWKIAETGYVYLLDLYVKQPMIVYILYFERHSGLIPLLINQGSVYALYYDFVKERNFRSLYRFDDNYYFRFQRIYKGRPQMKLDNLQQLSPKMLTPYFTRTVSRNLFKLLT